MSVIDIEVARSHLKIEGDSRDAEIARTLAQAESVVSERVGPLTEATFTERVHAASALILANRPVTELVSVASVGTGVSVDIGTLMIDGEGRDRFRVERLDGARFTRGRYTVTYKAGWSTASASLPEGLELAILELMRHLWAPKRGTAVRRPGSPVDTDRPPGYLFPYVVESALEPYTPTDGFA